NLAFNYNWFDRVSAQKITFTEGKSYSSDCIRRIAQNASIGDLHVALYGSSDFHREVYNLIKDINVIGELRLRFKAYTLEKEMMAEPFLLDLTK
ncbi:hypothetical protein PENTCL1PPCAC_19630, partial [Pristionchus entomophagus]